MNVDGVSKYHHLLAIPSPEKLRSVLKYLLDEDEFLSPYGIRALSRYHKDHPFEVNVEGVVHRVEYVAAESNTFMFGGNSNWRGPVWLCGRFYYNLVPRFFPLRSYFAEAWRKDIW